MNVIWQILFKDIKEIFRNKRALISGLLLPALFIPLLVYFQPYLNSAPESPDIHIALYDYRINQDSLAFVKALKSNDHLTVHRYHQNYKEANDKKNDLNIIIHQDSLRQNYLKVFYNSASSKSLKAFEYVSQIIFNNEINHIRANISDLNETESETTLPHDKKSPFSMYPWIFLMFGFSGAAFVASEIITGEKERHTLETLLSLLNDSQRILKAKYAGVLVFSLTNFLLNLLIMLISIFYFQGDISIHLFKESLLLFVAITPALFLLSAILLHIALNARTIHEARSIESVFFLIFSALIVSVSFVDINHSIIFQMLPFINTVLIIQTMSVSILSVLLLILSCFVPVFFIIKYNLQFIRQEKVLNTVASPTSSNHLALPLLIAAAIFLMLSRFSPLLIQVNYGNGILLSQLIFFFIPSLILIAFQRNKTKWMLFKKVPDIKTIISSIVITVLLFIVVNYYQQFVNSLFSRSVGTDQVKTPEYGIGYSLFLLCLIPAIAEEFFFRGWLFSKWFQKNDKAGIIASALIFAMFHQNYPEFLGLFILGIWFAYQVYLYHSIWTAVISHFVNNALVIWISRTHLNYHTHHSVGFTAFIVLIMLFKMIKPKTQLF
ncbi:MAG: ABC transporter permease [Candidatus Cloacimonetes bacterium]|nr:ABC transporter permease [Candidatus Cloacimonadota bacterium]